MSGAAAIHGCSLVLAHAPDLVRHGSKPARELATDRDGLLALIAGALRSYEDALGYPPHQVFVGNLRPDALWETERPWWRHPATPRREGPFGVIVSEEELYERMAAADAFQLFRLDDEPGENGAVTLFRDGAPAGHMEQAHDLDESLSAAVLLENLACKATGELALEHLLRRTGLPPEELEYALGCGEEAVGDRYQRGGGNLAKAIAEQAGCMNASGSDVKAFCCGPIHALVIAASLVSAGVYRHVAVVAGGSLAKLGMKFSGALKHGVPVLEDVLAGEWAWAASKALAAGVCMLAIISAAGFASFPHALLAIPVVVLIGLAFAALGLSVNALASGYDFFSYYMTLFLTPMMMLSGVFFPVERLPAPILALAQAMPLYHGVELVRPLLGGIVPGDAPMHLAVLAAYALAGFYLATVLTRRRLLQ